MPAFVKYLLALGLAAALAGGAVAQQAPAAAPVLAKITEQRTIYLGYRENQPPLTYTDGKGGVQGYQWDLCRRVADAIAARTSGGQLTIVPVVASQATAPQLLAIGTIDLDCGPVRNTLIAQKQFAFSLTTYVASLRVMVRRDAPVTRLADLAGKPVATLASTDGERALKMANALRGSTVEPVVRGSVEDAFRLLAEGKVVGLVIDDVGAARLMARPEAQGAYRVLDEALAFEPLAMMMRKDDPELKRLVDATLAAAMRDGSVEKSYARWFTSPIPPDGINLAWPMSDLLRALLAAPNDQGI